MELLPEDLFFLSQLIWTFDMCVVNVSVITRAQFNYLETYLLLHDFSSLVFRALQPVRSRILSNPTRTWL